MDKIQAALLARIEAFPLDEPGVALPFARRLARENGWSVSFAERVVAEYKRFVFLAMCAGHPVTPSEEVDQAWHLHLCYSESYWTRLCGEVLGRPLHHGPTKGGPAEHRKHCDWYEKTLASYRRLFGENPPADIWPATKERFRRAADYVRINRRENWVIPRPRWWPIASGLALFSLAGLLVAGCDAVLTNPFSIFDLRGPEFLRFYLVFAPAALALCGYLRWGLRVPREPLREDDWSVDPYAVAFLVGGDVQTVDTALASLAGRCIIQITAGTVVSGPAELPSNAPPIETRLVRSLKAPGGQKVSILRYRLQISVDKIAAGLREKGLILEHRQAEKVRLWPLLLSLCVPLIGLLKILVGMSRDKPVSYLLILTVLALAACFGFFGRRGFRTRRGDDLLRRLRAKNWDIRGTPSAKASPALAPDLFTFGLGLYGLDLLAGTAYAGIPGELVAPSATLHRSTRASKTADHDGGYSTSDSGCGGHSGCGGGSSGCGGGGGCSSGCGGCGGH